MALTAGDAVPEMRAGIPLRLPTMKIRKLRQKKIFLIPQLVFTTLVACEARVYCLHTLLFTTKRHRLAYSKPV